MFIEKNGFIHHVFFWLNDTRKLEDRKLLIKGLERLSKVNTIQSFHMGIPANTNRDAIDNSYSVSWLLLFKSKEDHDNYQTDAIHLKFNEECSHLWRKVVIYDTVNLV